MRKVFVGFSDVFQGYHITDADCPNVNECGCMCDDQKGHDITSCFRNDQRAILRLGLPDMENGEIIEMAWRTPLSQVGKEV